MGKYLKAIIALFTFYAVNYVTRFLTQLALVFHNPKFITAIITGEYTEEHIKIMHSPEVVGISYILSTIIATIFLVNTGIIDRRTMVRTTNIRWGYSLFGIVGAFILYFAFEEGLSYIIRGETESERATNCAYTYGIMYSIYLAFICPYVEECLFRAGVLGNLIKEGMNKWVALVISALIFGAAHWDLYNMIPTTVFGLITGWMYIKSKSVIPSAILHTLNNTISLIILYLLSDGTYNAMTEGISTILLTLICIFSLIIATIGTALYAMKK